MNTDTTPYDLNGRTAVVTGAGGGIGAAICEHLADAGANIVAVDIDDCTLEVLESKLDGCDCNWIARVCDVTDPDDVLALYESTVAAFDSVDIVVTAAGIGQPGRGKSLDQVSLNEWQRVLAVNLTGTFLVVRAFYKHMVANEYGKVVCIGSMSGVTGSKRPGPNYAASKGGVHSFTRWVATNGAEHGIHANAIAPGPVWTPMIADDDAYDESMTPLETLGRPADVARGVLFLSSEMSRYVTGTVLDMNGGLLMR